MPFAERRRCPRVPIHGKARLDVRGSEHHGIVIDISMWGALFAAQAPIQELFDHHCQLSVHDAADRLTIRLAGQIVHADDGQAGILFHNLDGKAVKRLKRITESRFGSAALLHCSVPALLR